MRVAVISLKRTPERWNAFLQRNKKALRNCEVVRIDGVDGSELLNSNIDSRLIAPSAHELWSAGAIGIGLSHLLCWRLCCNSKFPMVVLEDDVVLADSWELELKQLIHTSSKLLLLGWNLDSMLRAEFSQRQEIVSLFEPAYPPENALKTIVNSNDTKKSKRLRHSFGLPGYWLQPSMAEHLLNKIKRLESLPLHLGRGFPAMMTLGIDGMLNLHYHNIGAEVVIPPLALTLNNPHTSLTRHESNQFGKSII